MKGTLFQLLSDYVEHQHSLPLLNKLLADVPYASQGHYLNLLDYPDDEYIYLIDKISGLVNLKTHEFLVEFGQYCIPHLMEKYPHYFQYDTINEFLKNTQKHIYQEMEKNLNFSPKMNLIYQPVSNQKSTLQYSSSRKLCFLFEGILLGAIRFFNEDISITHKKCVHKGNDFCLFELDWKDGS